MSLSALTVFLSLVALGSSYNQPSSTCQARSSCASSFSNVESKLDQLSYDIQNLASSLTYRLDVIADQLQQLTGGNVQTTEPNTMEPPTSTPYQPNTSTPIQPNTSTPIQPTTSTPYQPPTHGCPGDGWRQVVFLNMSDPYHYCPDGLNMTEDPIRSCSRVNTDANTCDSVPFIVSGPEYNEVCGRAKAFRFGQSLGFSDLPDQHINSEYLDGLSITRRVPRQHVWSFVSGIYNGTLDSSLDQFRCPCAGGTSSPDFVGETHFCDSVTTVDNWDQEIFHSDNALWDGIDSADLCYDEPEVPWFARQFDVAVYEELELRLCSLSDASVSNIYLVELELYVRYAPAP